jgi:2'-5' RNA ligase
LAFLGIRVNQDIGRLITKLDVPGEKEHPSEYHITILCFEDNWPISELCEALEITYQVVSKIPPFRVTAKKVSHFPPQQDKPIPIIAPIESKELHDLHRQLFTQFEKSKIDFKKTFKDYKPHITLAFSKDDHDDYPIDPPIDFIVNEIVLFGGDLGDDRIFVTFPLKGPTRTKHSFLLEKVNLFHKLADNYEQSYLTPSRNRRRQEP